MKKNRSPRQTEIVMHSVPHSLFRKLEAAPTIVQFESICGCNASCTFCSYAQMKRNKGLMSNALIQSIISQAANAQSLIPFLIGEPFMDSRMREILMLCKRLQPQAATVLYSNMSLCDKKAAEWIVSDQTLDRLCPSFYGPTPHIYRQLQPPLDFHDVRQNIIHLLRLRELHGLKKPVVDMQYILMEQTVSYLNQFKSYWGVLADSVSVVKYETWHGLKPDNLKQERIERPIPCSRLWESINIHWDGTVVACCLDLEQEEIIGRLPEQTIEQVWHGKKLQELRALHLSGNYSRIPLCRACTAWASGPSWWVRFWNQALYGNE